MAQTSDSLILEARLAAEPRNRSIDDQVELWARLGRAVDDVLGGPRIAEMMRNGTIKPLSECVASIDTPEGRARFFAYLETLPFPHFKAHPDKPNLLIRIETDGTQSVGRFKGREWLTSAD
jgi:hypothetical protein